MIYLDSSAIVKLIVREPESEALQARIRGGAIVSSELALTEVPRAIWRVRIGRRGTEQEALRHATQRTLEALALVPLERSALIAAGTLPPAPLRALDAIHIVAALTIADDLACFVTYDRRQQEGVEAAGLPLGAPA